MEKRDYFCIVKYSEDILKTVLSTIIILIINSTMPVEIHGNTRSTDSVEVSLLTCSPHDEIYSLYGHTALRYRDLRTREDWAFNYGVFNFKKPFFVLRFTFGITDYELGVIPFSIFQQEYRKYGSQVTEQVLNMTSEEKQRVYDALKANYLPENRTYRYNFFYDNCTTRARDMVERCINGNIQYAGSDTTVTYREMIHEKTSSHPWAAFGNDLCLGVKADMRTTPREQQFLPENLMRYFEHAIIETADGQRALVKESRTVVEPGVQIVQEGFPFSPKSCAYILLAISIIVIYTEYKRGKIYKSWDVFLMTCSGITGTVVFALFFSEHPTTSTNLQILLLNPIALFFIPSVIRNKNTFWKLSVVLIVLFFIGALFQDYAKGMEIVALCLLLRCGIHLSRAYRPLNKNDLRNEV